MRMMQRWPWQRRFTLKFSCLFMVSTHILEVGQALKSVVKISVFVYLPTKMEGSTPVYTYQLTEGITNDRHGMIIINNERIMKLSMEKRRYDEFRDLGGLEYSW